MEHKYNKKLKELADASAVLHSVVPVLICDEHLFVCTKSIGVDRLLEHMPLKRSIADRFTSEAIEKINNRNVRVFFTEFGLGNISAPAVITKGVVSEQPYVSVILEPKLIFTSLLPDKYCDEACCAIADSLDSLLNASEKNTSMLKHRCLQLSRLCSILGTHSLPKPIVPSPAINIPEFIDLFASNCETAMPLVGMSIQRIPITAASPSTNIPSRLFQITVSTLLMSALSFSSNGNIELSCIELKDDNKVEISFAASITKELAAAVDNYSNFEDTAIPMRLELSALKSVAPIYGIDIGFSIENEKITFFCRIPTFYGRTAEMHSSDEVISIEFMQMLREMYDFVTEQRKFG